MWVRLDDGFYDHPKIRALGFEAAGFLVALMCWSTKHLTDGLVPEETIRDLSGHPRRFHRLMNPLIDAGCLERTATGTTPAYRIHDWDDYQCSSADVKAQRRAATQRKRRQREKQRHGPDHGVTSRDERAVSQDPVPYQSCTEDHTRPERVATATRAEGSEAARDDIPENDSGGDVRQPRPVAALVELKVGLDEARDLVVRYGPERVLEVAAAVRSRPDIRNRAAYVVKALENDWEPAPAVEGAHPPDLAGVERNRVEAEERARAQFPDKFANVAATSLAEVRAALAPGRTLDAAAEALGGPGQGEPA